MRKRPGPTWDRGVFCFSMFSICSVRKRGSIPPARPKRILIHVIACPGVFLRFLSRIRRFKKLPKTHAHGWIDLTVPPRIAGKGFFRSFGRRIAPGFMILPESVSRATARLFPPSF